MVIVTCTQCGNRFDDGEIQMGLTPALIGPSICSRCGAVYRHSIDEIVRRAQAAKRRMDGLRAGDAPDDPQTSNIRHNSRTGTPPRTVYFIGAGFSRAAGVPLVAGFCPAAQALAERGLDSEKDESLNDLVGRWKRLRTLRSDNAVSLEDVFNDVLQKWRASGSKEEAKSLFDRLPTAICRVIYDSCGIYTANDIWNGRPENCYIDFIKRTVGEEPGAVSFITTNYDPLIEFSILGIGSYNVDFAIRTLVRPFHPEPAANKQSVTVLKLHGSTSWAVCSSESCWSHKEKGILARDADPRWLPVSFGTIPLPCPACRQHTLRPLLVPPARGKEIRYSDIFEEISERARDVLANSDRWVFVGFALNPYDTHVMDEFFDSALKRGGGKEIVAVDPSQTVLDRFEGTLGSRSGKLLLHRATFEDALRANLFGEPIAARSPAPQRRSYSIECPESRCAYCKDSRMRVVYETTYIDEDSVETREFTLSCPACGRETKENVPILEGWISRGKRTQATSMGELLQRASILANAEPSTILTSARHYEVAKDVLLGIGLKPIPSRGCPLVVHVNSEAALETAFRELVWANPLIVRFSVRENAQVCTLASEMKDTWSYTVVSRFHWSPELPQVAARHAADIASGRVSLQIHDFEYFTLAQRGSFVHGGPRLGDFPNRPFAVVESQQQGWIPSLPEDMEEKSDSAPGWEAFSDLLRSQADHPLAEFLSSTLQRRAGRVAADGPWRAELRPGLTLSRYRLECPPHLKLTWQLGEV